MNESETTTEVEKREVPVKQRGNALKCLLYFQIFATVFAAFKILTTSSSELLSYYPDAPSWAPGGLKLLGLLQVVVLVGVWKWKKWAVYCYIGIALLTSVINSEIFDGGLMPLIGLAFAGLILYFVRKQWADFE